MVSFFLQMTTKSSTVPFFYLLPKGFVKSKKVNMPHEYMASYIPGPKYRVFVKIYHVELILW